jgi:hypothetical protein
LNNVLLANLTPAERRAVGSVELLCPLLLSDQNSPINFYALNGPPRIVAPVLSIKFLDDLAIASTWLLLNGYSQSTVYNYLSMIKYRRPAEMPQGRFPPPLKALRIPAGVLDDSRVYALSEKIFGSALLFVLAHELGHIRYSHPGYDIPLDQAKQNELAADAFAVELMRRVGLPPLGVTHFFMAATYLCPHRGDFTTDDEWEHFLRTEFTHPVSSQRLHILAGQLQDHARDFAKTEPDHAGAVNLINASAGQLEDIAGILSDYGIQQTIAHIGRTTSLSTLKPIPEGRLAADDYEEDNQANARGPFNGVYRGTFTTGQSPEGILIAVKFTRKGQRVIGEYAYGAGNGELSGEVKGNALYFHWKEGPSFGRGVFKSVDEGARFHGTWGFDQSRDNGGYWEGKKQ